MKTATLLTGICSSGKTHYAASQDWPSLSYDSIRNYQEKTTDYAAAGRWAKKHAETSHVTVDAWGFADDPDLKVLDKIFHGNRLVDIKYLYMTPLQLHLAQLKKEVLGEIELQPHQAGFRNHTGQLSKEMAEFSANTLLPLAHNGTSVEWLFRENAAILTHNDDAHLRQVVATDPVDELLDWIHKTSHDPNYQAIELDGETIQSGYMQSDVLWQQIKKLGIRWQSKTVCDLGCFNGYFSFAVEREGAHKVVAYDRDDAVGKVFARLSLLNKSQCVFVGADLSQGLPPGEFFDVALLLNSLHHIMEKSTDGGRDFLDGVFIRANEVVAVVNQEHVPLLEAAAVRGGHYLHIMQPRSLHESTDQPPRQLLYFTSTPEWT